MVLVEISISIIDSQPIDEWKDLIFMVIYKKKNSVWSSSISRCFKTQTPENVWKIGSGLRMNAKGDCLSQKISRTFGSVCLKHAGGRTCCEKQCFYLQSPTHRLSRCTFSIDFPAVFFHKLNLTLWKVPHYVWSSSGIFQENVQTSLNVWKQLLSSLPPSYRIQHPGPFFSASTITPNRRNPLGSSSSSRVIGFTCFAKRNVWRRRLWSGTSPTCHPARWTDTDPMMDLILLRLLIIVTGKRAVFKI